MVTQLKVTTCWFTSFAALAVAGGSLMAADPPTADKALRLQPVQRDVAIDRPEGDAIAQCSVKAERIGSATGWVVRDPGGQVLRKFLDTNADNYVDQWSYYRDGIEVYRDVDANFNQKADQFRWLNTGGSRFGLDTNEDGTVDSWQTISAEEVTAELVAALRDRDAARFERLMLSTKELKALGLGKAKGEFLARQISMAPAAFEKFAGEQKVIGPKSRWVSFGGSQPGTVPAGWEDSSADIMAYEHVAAMVETDGKPQTINVGTLVRVENTWRLIDAPRLMEDGTDGEPVAFFFTAPRNERAGDVVSKPSDEVTKLMEELRKLDAELLNGGTPEQHERRIAIIEQLAQKDPQSRNQWYRQMADTLSASAQNGSYPAGTEKLRALQEKIKAAGDNDELAAYMQYRLMTAEHVKELADPAKQGEFGKIQTRWAEDLEKFVEAAKQYPDTVDAMLELAVTQEFSENDENAVKWYEQIVATAPAGSPIHRKAEGAKRRLQSVGTTIRLSGKTADGQTFDLGKLRGKVVLIQYWATWCEPCKADMPLLKDLRSKFKGAFEVVGVCLDNNAQDMTAFLQENDPRWPQIFEEGGLESRPALEMGIQSLPTMILVDKQGSVANRNIRAQELETEVKKLLK
jgi:thiol-disulfide isomerase/thioredoxin